MRSLQYIHRQKSTLRKHLTLHFLFVWPGAGPMTAMSADYPTKHLDRSNPGREFPPNFRAIDITDENTLAWIGSGHGSGVIAPTIAIKWQESGEVCGLLFDPYAEQHDLNKFPGANYYWAFELKCDETRGKELELKSATYPDYFEEP